MDDIIKHSKEYYKDVINERLNFSMFVKKNLKKNIESDILIPFYNFVKHQDNVAVWIGGSQSWENIFNCNINEISEDILSKSSITAGNYDIFILTNNKEAYNKTSCHLNNLIVKYKEVFDESSNSPNYTLTYKSDFIKKKNGICIPNVDELNVESCVLFPCQASQLTIKSKQSSQNDTGFKIKNKLLVYFEAYYLENININMLKNMINSYCKLSFKDSNIPYLTEYGLIMFSEFIIYKRIEKGLNVDKYRKELLLKHLSPYIKLNDLYFNVLDYYIGIFKDSKEYNKYIVQNIILNIFKYSNFDIVKIIEEKIINITRPFINRFIYNFSQNIEQEFQNAFFCLIGGDAMRRYDYNITKTSDYDTKLFVPLNYNKGKSKELLHNFIIDKMSFFIAYLITNKKDILLDFKYEHYYTSKDITIKIVYNINTLHNSQFRLRFIQKYKEFKIDLYSIDYRTIADVFVIHNTTKQEIKYNINIDIPLFDLVIVILDKNLLYENQTKDDILNHNNVINVASLDFLLNDLITTYTKRDPSNRYFYDKNDKDKYRYNLLNNIKHFDMDADLSSNTKLNTLIDNNVYEHYNSDLVKILQKEYINEFNKIYLDNKSNDIIKHKMSFNFGVSNISQYDSQNDSIMTID